MNLLSQGCIHGYMTAYILHASSLSKSWILSDSASCWRASALCF